MTAVVPKRSLISSSAPSSSAASSGSNGSSSWNGRSSARFASEMPISVRPRRSIRGCASASRSRAAARTTEVRAVGAKSVHDRVAREKSSKRRRRTTVRPTRCAARTRRMTRSTIATRSASTSSGERRPRPRACCDPIERRRGRMTHPPRVAEVRERVQVAAGRPAEHRLERTLGHARQVADRRDAAAPELRGGRLPDAPHRLDGQRVQEGALAVGRHEQEPVGLRRCARDLGEELRAGDSDRDGDPDALAHRAAAGGGRSRAASDAALHPAHVEEGLVDREPLDERGRVLEHGVERLARLGVGAHPRRHDDGLGAETQRLAPAHRRVHAVGLRLVARGEHDAQPRRSPAGRAGRDRRAARRRRRTSPRRHAGSRMRTSVRMMT